MKSIKNEPVINEITEDDVNDLSDQIRQLKVRSSLEFYLEFFFCRLKVNRNFSFMTFVFCRKNL